MALTQDDLNKIAATVWGSKFGNSLTTGTMLQRAALNTAVDPTVIAAAVVAALPKGTGGTLAVADVETALRNVLRNGVA